MTRNMGSLDRTVRTVVGVAILAVGIYFRSWWGAIGLIPLFTAAVGWCPAYLPFGLSTCGKKTAAGS
jgi:hypothetical protein